jgi:hypothetical protein
MKGLSDASQGSSVIQLERVSPVLGVWYRSAATAALTQVDLDTARSSFLQATQSASAKQAFSELMLGALDRNSDPSDGKGHFTAALRALDQPTYLMPFERAEIQALALAALGRTQEAATVFERAVIHRSAADVFQRYHYELFAAPTPPPGITALMEIWRGIIAIDPTAALYGPPPLHS